MHELELEAARIFNPFCVSGLLHTLTSLPPDDWISRLGSLVGPLPAEEFSKNSYPVPWREWWDEYMPSWSDETLAKVWELFDAVRFYAILEVESE
jgi:hypothetical protein